MTGPGAVARPWASPTKTRTPRVRRFPAAPTRRVARAYLRRLRATLLPRPTGEQVARRRYLRPTTLTASGAVVAERMGPLSSRRSDPCCLASPYPLVAVAGRAVSQRGAGMPGRPAVPGGGWPLPQPLGGGPSPWLRRLRPRRRRMLDEVGTWLAAGGASHPVPH